MYRQKAPNAGCEDKVILTKPKPSRRSLMVRIDEVHDFELKERKI